MDIIWIKRESKEGIIIKSKVPKHHVLNYRKLSGDLVFNNNNTINQEDFWLFDWEKKDPDCYAKKMQKAKVSVAGYKLITT